ncbi:alpha/beta hydrolase [Tropicibacter sp. Alg240-R139]|uniref:alpha/beta hydrolase n=1 Tax=Tropicibacter sp. Alg240-R139 TaxID=2305991 RepID=UPI001F07706B|nr:alpha/beta hydrolase [Tropicibacter sp. Alg240-R139]
MIVFLIVLIAMIIVVPFAIEARRKVMGAEDRQEAPGEFVELSQGVTHYQWHGPVRGPIAVCVHGLTTPSFVWQGLASGLSAMGYRVLTYDLYGRGYSDRPDGAQTDAFFLQQLKELLDAQQVTEDFTLIGYSMGGAISTCFAAKHPDMVRLLVLLAPAGMSMATGRMAQFIRRTPLVGDWMMMALFPARHQREIEAERDLTSSVPDITDLQLRELEYQGFTSAVLSSLRGILGRELKDEHRAIHQAGVPVLAIWGRNDAVIPLTAMGQLTEWSRSTRQEVIEDAGHGLTYTHTDDVLEILSGRLNEGLS